MKKNNTFKNIVLKALLVLFSILTSFLFIEFILILTYSELNYAPFSWEHEGLYRADRDRIYATSKEFIFMDEFNDMVISTDDQGFRSTVNAAKNVRKKILLIGDSFIWGLHVDDKDTVASNLQKLIDVNNLEYEIINAGVPGYSIGQEYSYLKTVLIPQLKPDLIIWNIHPGDFNEMKHRSVYLMTEGELKAIPSYLHGVYIDKKIRETIPNRIISMKTTTLLLNYLQLFDPVSFLERFTGSSREQKIVLMLNDINENENLIITRTPSMNYLVDGINNLGETWMSQGNIYSAIKETNYLNSNSIIKAVFDQTGKKEFKELFLESNIDSSNDYWRHLSEYGNRVYAEVIFHYLDIQDIIELNNEK
jgi:hypothetical protein